MDLCELAKAVNGAATTTASASAAGDGPLAPDDELRVLLVRCGDPRHFLKTLARRLRSSTSAVSVFMWEPSPECLVRSLALVAIALDWSIPVRQRAHMFLEVFGNVRVQDKTARYLDSVRDAIVSLVCDREGRLAGTVDPSELSHRDIDSVHEAAKRLGYGVEFDASDYWDHRIRSHYGERFDFRKNIADWDFQNHVRPVCGWIHPVLFRDWRNSGLAFEFGDETYTQPNRTLSSYTEGRERGLSKLVYGYWGDVVCTPYWALGTTAEHQRAADVGQEASRAAASLFKITNRHSGSEQFRHNTAQIAVLNVLAMLTEIETHSRYKMKREHDIYSGLGSGTAEAGASDDDDEEEDGALDDEGDAEDASSAAASGAGGSSKAPPSGVVSVSKAAKTSVGALPMAPERRAERRRTALLARSVRRATTAAETLKGVRLVPLLGGDLEKLLGRSRHRNRYDGVVMGARAAQLLCSPQLPQCLRRRAFVAQETARNLVVFSEYQKREFVRRALLMAGGAGLELKGTGRSLLRSDGWAVGSGTDVRSREAKRRDAEALAAKLREDDEIRKGCGAQWPMVKLQRQLERWDDHRGEKPRPEVLVFRWREEEAEEMAALMREGGAAGAVLRDGMAKSQAEKEEEEEAEAKRNRAEAEAAKGIDRATTAPREAAKAKGAGGAWQRGGLGKKTSRLAEKKGEEAAAASSGSPVDAEDASEKAASQSEAE